MAISPRTQPVDGTPGVLRTMRAGRQNDAEMMSGGTKISVCAVLEQHRRREFMSKGSVTRLLGSLHHAAAISNGSMNLGPLPLTADGLANAGGAALAAENEVGVRTALIDVSPLMQTQKVAEVNVRSGPALVQGFFWRTWQVTLFSDKLKGFALLLNIWTRTGESCTARDPSSAMTGRDLTTHSKPDGLICGAAHVSSRRPSRRRRRPRHRHHRCHRRCRPFSGVGVGRGDRARPSRHCEVGNALAQVQQE